jgi:hypothetical protein
VLGLVARIVPSLRRKLRAAQRVVDTGLLDALPGRWESEFKPRLEKEIRRYAAMDLAVLTDAALFEHLDELTAFSVRNI